MSKPDGISQELWDEACKADAACHRSSCQEADCNGFLCAQALRIAIMAAKAEEREACRLLSATHNNWGTTWEHNHTALPQTVAAEIADGISSRGQS